MTTTTKKRTQQRALPWFGADTLVCERYATLLARCRHVTIPFAGGLSIVRPLVEHGAAQEIVCNDRHHFAINFYRVIAQPSTRQQLLDALEAMPFHGEILRERQFLCSTAGDSFERLVKMGDSSVAHAVNYLVTAWMGRGGKGGAMGEFRGELPARFSASGGASPKRFRTAVESVRELWGGICERCSFLCKDWSDLLESVTDDPACGLYADPPWVGAGGDYVHKFTADDHAALARRLSGLTSMRIVVRYGDHPMIRQLYAGWTITPLTGRDQANNDKAELCITNWKPETV